MLSLNAARVGSLLAEKQAAGSLAMIRVSVKRPDCWPRKAEREKLNHERPRPGGNCRQGLRVRVKGDGRVGGAVGSGEKSQDSSLPLSDSLKGTTASLVMKVALAGAIPKHRHSHE